MGQDTTKQDSGSRSGSEAAGRLSGQSDPLDPSSRLRKGFLTAAIGLLLAVAGVVALAAVFGVDNWGEGGSGLSGQFASAVDQVAAVDAKLVAYEETGKIAVAMQTLRAVAATADRRVLVAGDRAVQVYQPDGAPSLRLALSGEPTSVAVAGAQDSHPGRIYVGVGARLELCDAGGEPAGSWSEGLDERSMLTSLAVFEDNVFGADAGNRVVLRWDAEGRLINVIGQPDPQRNIRGFVLPSFHFDVAVHRDGVLRVSNPGARRIEAFTLDGDPLGHWGEASPRIEGFFGCCNPSHFAMLSDGRFVTSEKGIPRIKVYSQQGEFESVVATPQQLAPSLAKSIEIRDDHSLGVFDVAVDEADEADDAQRVYVLDPNQRRVRIFERKGTPQDATPST